MHEFKSAFTEGGRTEGGREGLREGRRGEREALSHA